MNTPLRTVAMAFLTAGPATLLAPSNGVANMENQTTAPAEMAQNHPFVGMWVTADGRIRQELLPNGRYDEARGSRQSAYQGRYEVTGNDIYYWDDTGFTADGRFEGDVLYHGGMVFHREK
ncbi:Atu4866 domain-containing protein [Ciceribacter sp. L1K22]|uniref:Atu4866 domain-containing protein n=1 Tax=Ciceribacter sp. L1K22 TaxID=2820275 RepID=UPI001FEEE225|nr:Atu4866 domain-containing protein [Ciceribacter sp. L1K22]